MPRIAALALVVAALLFVGPEPAYAQACPAGTLWQGDMAGVYLDPTLPMRVQVYPCSGVHILWDNAYGRHSAYYRMTIQAPGGGVIGHGFEPDPHVGYLDNAYTIGVKPAEPGFVQLITVDPYGNFVGVYRLPKLP